MYKKFICAIVLIHAAPLHTTTVVYNMQVAEITKRLSGVQNAKKHNTISETAFWQWRKLYNDTSQSTFAALTTYLYTKEHFYFKIDGAIGHVRFDLDPIVIKLTQTDDLLFTGGYGHSVGTYGRIAYSALLGIPTHRDTFLDIAQFGTGHVGTGLQLDGTYDYMHDQTNVILAAVRAVRFYPRSISSKNPCFRPLYPCPKYNFKLGNSLDLYVAHQTNWRKINRFEGGYNATFLDLGSGINPDLPGIGASAVYIRHSFFGAYFRCILIKKVQTGLVIGFSGGFDSKPKIFGNRYLLSSWLIYGILF